MLKLDNKLRKIYPQINVDHFYTWHNTFLKTFFFLFLRRRIKFENVTIKVKICGMTFPLFCKHITTQVPAIDYLVSIFMPLLIKNRQTSSWTLPFGANTLRVEYVRGVLLSHEVSSLSEFPMSCRLLVSAETFSHWSRFELCAKHSFCSIKQKLMSVTNLMCLSVKCLWHRKCRMFKTGSINLSPFTYVFISWDEMFALAGGCLFRASMQWIRVV